MKKLLTGELVMIEMNKLRSDKKTTKQVRIDAGLHHLLKVRAASEKTTIRALIEGELTELLAVRGS